MKIIIKCEYDWYDDIRRDMRRNNTTEKEEAKRWTIDNITSEDGFPASEYVQDREKKYIGNTTFEIVREIDNDITTEKIEEIREWLEGCSIASLHIYN